MTKIQAKLKRRKKMTKIQINCTQRKTTHHILLQGKKLQESRINCLQFARQLCNCVPCASNKACRSPFMLGTSARSLLPVWNSGVGLCWRNASAWKPLSPCKPSRSQQASTPAIRFERFRCQLSAARVVEQPVSQELWRRILGLLAVEHFSDFKQNSECFCDRSASGSCCG